MWYFDQYVMAVFKNFCSLINQTLEQVSKCAAWKLVRTLKYMDISRGFPDFGAL